MTNRYKLTTGFLVISVAIFALAAVVITQSARQNEEAGLIEVVSEQSGRDARVIAGVITGIALSPDPTPTGLASPSDSSGGFDSLAISTFLRNSNIVRLSLYQVDGALIWSSVESAPVHVSNENKAFVGALAGETVTGLQKNAQFDTADGSTVTGDLTSTYIPLLDASTSQTAQVLEVSRDVTSTLHARIETARSSMFQTVFTTLGGAFMALFVVVLSADILIRRSRTRALLQERALADEKVVASKLELENQQLRQINEERDRFLSMVSHELRTPLTTIMGFTDVLKRRQEGDKAERNKQHLDLMRKNGEHLNGLIEEMLEITRIEAGKFEVVKEGFLLDKLLEQIEESARVMFKPRSQTFRIEKQVDGVELHGDRRRVMQVLLNLLSNASKYSPKDSTITLYVQQQGDSVRMSVGDEGPGIPEDDKDLLFERFYRRDDEVTRSQSGLGLGLSIVEAIVDAHHGSIEIDSKVGAGTTLTVTLPGARLVGTETEKALSPEAVYEMERLQRLGDLRSLPHGAKAAS